MTLIMKFHQNYTALTHNNGMFQNNIMRYYHEKNIVLLSKENQSK